MMKMCMMALVGAALPLASKGLDPDPAFCRHQTIQPSTGQTIVFSQLHLIKPVDGSLDFAVEDSSNEAFSYNFRVCENVVNQCGDKGPTPVCQRDRTGNTWSLGTLESQFILDYPSLDKSRGVMIEYSNGTLCPSTNRSRRILITIECDPNSVGPISTITAANHQNEDPCEYEMYARSQYACPDVADNVCAGIAGCTGCTALTGCGYCAATMKCVSGTPLGPTDGSFCLGSKSYYYGTDSGCPDCPAINSCSECNANPNCKWCDDGNCMPYLERECEERACSCPSCRKGEYCPPEGGSCKKLPNTAGLFVGGMFLGFAIVGIAVGGYVFYKRNNAEYQGLA